MFTTLTTTIKLTLPCNSSEASTVGLHKRIETDEYCLPRMLWLRKPFPVMWNDDTSQCSTQSFVYFGLTSSADSISSSPAITAWFCLKWWNTRGIAKSFYPKITVWYHLKLYRCYGRWQSPDLNQTFMCLYLW